jgi:hypothetical protein
MKSGFHFAAVFLILTGCGEPAKVATPPPPSDVVFEARPQVVAPGESATLHWNIPGATSVIIEAAPSRGQMEMLKIGSFGATGETKVTPSADTTYVVTCEGSKSVTCMSVSVRVRIKQ